MCVKYNKANLVVLTFVGLFLGSCKSNSTTNNSEAAYISKTDTVFIEQMAFTPAELAAHKGDTILFINKDIVAHDVTEKGEKWASPTLNMDDSWSKIADDSFDYFCSIHVVMTGKVKVVK
jgi:plastocyanin